MFDAMKLLGSMLQGQATPATAGRWDMAAQSANYPPQPQPQPQSRGLGSMGAGALGALGGAMLGDRGPGVIGSGLLAIAGNMAFQALQAHMAGSAAPPPVNTYAQPTPDLQRKATLMIRAMIQAAKADGTVDPVEMQRIMGKVQEHGHDPSANAFVSAEMAKPIDLPGLCRDVTSPQEAAEVYAASVMTLDVDSQAERNYLEDLARSLGIAPPVVAQINRQVGIT